MREEWKYKKLGEVCTIKAGYTPQKNELSDNGAYPYYKVADMNTLGNDVYLDITSSYKIDANKLFPKGAIVFPKNGAAVSTNKKRILKYDSIVDLNTGVAIFPKSINEKFAYYWFIDTDFKKYVRGGALPTLDIKSLKDKPFPSIDKSIQLAIVSELDKINELIRLKKEQLKDFDNLAQSILYEMFGDPVENEKGWEVKKLNDISQEIGDGLHGTPEYSDVDTGCFFINGNNLENGIIVIKDNTKTVSEKTKAKHYIEMDDFTILVSINGTLGKVAFYRGENVILGKSACYIKLTSYNDKKYIYELLKSEYFKRYAETECTGTTIRNVSLKSMRNFPIPLPPLPLQHLFAHRIEQIEHQKAEVQKAITDLETLLASRMQYWFE